MNNYAAYWLEKQAILAKHAPKPTKCLKQPQIAKKRKQVAKK